MDDRAIKMYRYGTCNGVFMYDFSFLRVFMYVSLSSFRTLFRSLGKPMRRTSRYEKRPYRCYRGHLGVSFDIRTSCYQSTVFEIRYIERKCAPTRLLLRVSLLSVVSWPSGQCAWPAILRRDSAQVRSAFGRAIVFHFFFNFTQVIILNQLNIYIVCSVFRTF